MDTKSIYQPGFIHGEISHEIFMHKKLSKNKRDLNGLHKNMVIALAPIFSSYLKSTFRIDDLFPATNTMILYRCSSSIGSNTKTTMHICSYVFTCI